MEEISEKQTKEENIEFHDQLGQTSALASLSEPSTRHGFPVFRFSNRHLFRFLSPRHNNASELMITKS
jgi:hypothetical protein